MMLVVPPAEVCVAEGQSLLWGPDDRGLTDSPPPDARGLTDSPPPDARGPEEPHGWAVATLCEDDPPRLTQFLARHVPGRPDAFVAYVELHPTSGRGASGFTPDRLWFYHTAGGLVFLCDLASGPVFRTYFTVEEPGFAPLRVERIGDRVDVVFPQKTKTAWPRVCEIGAGRGARRGPWLHGASPEARVVSAPSTDFVLVEDHAPGAASPTLLLAKPAPDAGPGLYEVHRDLSDFVESSLLAKNSGSSGWSYTSAGLAGLTPDGEWAFVVARGVVAALDLTLECPPAKTRLYVAELSPGARVSRIYYDEEAGGARLAVLYGQEKQEEVIVMISE